jgi:hypothetical protein
MLQHVADATALPSNEGSFNAMPKIVGLHALPPAVRYPRTSENSA